MNIKQELRGNDLSCEADKCGCVVDLIRELCYEEIQGKDNFFEEVTFEVLPEWSERSQLREILSAEHPRVKEAVVNKGPRQQYPGVFRTQSIWEPVEGVAKTGILHSSSWEGGVLEFIP